MATTWSPRTTFERKTWLLTNGEVVHEPPLEETPSGQKVRVAGTELSVYARDVDSLIRKAVFNIAERKQTHVWMPLSNAAAQEIGRLGYNPTNEKAKLHFIQNPTDRNGKTHLWWKFKHPTLPIEATLTVRIASVHQYGNNPIKPQHVSGYLVHPFTTLDDGTHDEARFVIENDTYFTGIQDDLDGYDERTKVREFVRDNPPSWDTSILGGEQHSSERLGVAALLKRVRVADALGSIQILDLREPEDPTWMDLELFETNCNSQFIADLADYLDGAPSVEQAAQLYIQLLTTLRSIGLVMEGKSENDFMAALLSGDKDSLSVSLGNATEQGHSVDQNHRLTLHLPTGAFVVECQLHAADRNTVAEKWDEALMMAQFTGQEDELLAYAKEYARRESKKRTAKILKERKDATVIE